MPLKIIRNDLLKIKCDAIVNPTDVFLSGSGSVDKKIHDACKKELEKELIQFKDLYTTKAVITKSYDLKTCKYIIHAIGPKFTGDNSDYDLLRQCIRNVFNVVKEENIKSVAIPLISTGTFRFPKKEAYLITLEEIHEFLVDNNVRVYLVVYDNESFSISKELSQDVKSYIDDNYVENDFIASIPLSSKRQSSKPFSGALLEVSSARDNLIDDFTCNAFNAQAFELDESFSEAVLRIIREKDLYEPDVYKKAGLDRKLFSTIRSKKNYVPSKKTAVALCIGLELDLKQSNELLMKAGFTLSHSNLFDVIIEYFIKNKKYDLYDINAVLIENDQELLG